MKQGLGLICVALLLAACGGGGGGGGGGGDGGTGPAATDARATTMQLAASPQDLVVMLQPGADPQALAAAHGAQVLAQFGRRPIYRLRAVAPATPQGLLAALQAHAQVRFAELNADTDTPEGRQQVVWAYGSADTLATQWAPQALGLAQAHALSTGAGVRVAVLDGGVDLHHPWLAPRLARSAGGALLGRDFVDDDADPGETALPSQPGWGHGTHVAGLVLLAAPQAQLMPLRVLDNAGRGNAWVLAEALMWAVDPDGNPATDDGAHVVNLSLGSTRATRLLNTALELATCSDDDDNEDDDDYSAPGFAADHERCNLRRGAVVLAAAGNSASASELHYPAAEGAEGQLAITASAPGQRLAGFANHGSWVQLAAPGQGISSALPGGAYGVWSGSSMATPLAAGVAALVLARQPDWKPVDVTKRLQDRSAALCGSPLRALHAWGAVADQTPPDPACP